MDIKFWKYVFIANLLCGLLAFIIKSVVIADYLPEANVPEDEGYDYEYEEKLQEKEIRREFTGKFIRDTSLGLLTIFPALFYLTVYLSHPNPKGR